MNARLLICGAFAPEINILKSLNKQALEFNGSWIVQVLETGIGSVNAAATIASIDYQAFDRNEILFIGSCGLYDNEIHSYENYLIEYVTSIPISSFSSEYHYPEPLKNIYHYRNRLLDYRTSVSQKIIHSIDAMPAVCNTTDTVTLKKVQPESITGLFPDFDLKGMPVVENLECIGVLSGASRHNTGLNAVLACTNLVCENGSAQWKENFQERSHQLQRSILDILSPMLQ